MGVANISGNILTDSGASLSSYLPLTGGTLTGALNGTSATFSDLVTTTSVYRIVQASASRGGLYTYNQVAGSGTDYSLGIASEGEAFITTGGTATKRLTIASTGAATFSSTSGIGATIQADWDRSATNNNQLYIRGNSNTNKQLRLGYDTTGNVGYIQALTSGTSVDNLLLNPSGGRIGIGQNAPGVALSVAGQTENWQLAVTSVTGTAGAVIGSPSANVLAFGDWSGAERMRITSGGEVGIGVIPATIASGWKYTQVGNLALMGPSPATDQNGIIGANAYYNGGYKRIISGYATVIEMNYGSGNLGTFTAGSGSAGSAISFTAGPYVANGGVSWTNGSSDIRKKKNFEPSQGLAELLQIEAVKYHFNWDKDDDKKRLGFKAQNLQNLIPEMVSETGEIAEDGTSYLTITPDYLLPVLVKAIQEQNEIINNLSAKVTALENK